MSRKPKQPTPSFTSGPGAYEPYTRASYDTRTVAQARQERRGRAKRRAAIVLAGVIVAAVVLAVGCAWSLWLRYDDAADMCGTWRSSTGAIVVIDSHTIQLTDSVAYDYTVDARAKTIDFSFGTTTGHATYRFAQDRAVLVIDETGDAGWLVWLNILPDPVLQGGAAPEGVSVLYRQ